MSKAKQILFRGGMFLFFAIIWTAGIIHLFDLDFPSVICIITGGAGLIYWGYKLHKIQLGD